MQRFAPRISWLIVLVFALSSIGANPSSQGCQPSGTQSYQGTQSNPDSTLPLCYMDPPVGCVAFCIDVDLIAFTPMCENPASDKLTILFKDKVLSDAAELELQGVQVCPVADSKHWVTPCNVGITPQEWPNQDHESCQPVPPGCQY